MTTNFKHVCHSTTTATTTVLAHVARYRLTTAQALCRVFPNRWPTRRTAERQLNSLVAKGLLGTEPLFRHQGYYFLTEGGRDALAASTEHDLRGDGASPTGPLSELAKIRTFAFLGFCCLGNQRRERLTADELQHLVPDLYRPRLALNYYVDPSIKPTRLGFLRIDTGGHGRWDRIVQKCRADLLEHVRLPVVQRLIAERRFEFTVLTISRLYKDENQWKDSTSFRRDDLPVVAKAIDMAYAWIWDRHTALDQDEVS